MPNENQSQVPSHSNSHNGIKLKNGPSTAPMAAVTVGTGTNAVKRLFPHDLCNSEYVSRLVAATPPFLYSAPVGANNFFFSDMLRSIGHVRNSENIRNLEKIQQSIITKRQRKRAWSQYHHRTHLDQKIPSEIKDYDQAVTSGGDLTNHGEKPLELTNKMRSAVGGCGSATLLANKYSRTELDEDCLEYSKVLEVRDGDALSASDPSSSAITTTRTTIVDNAISSTDESINSTNSTALLENTPSASNYNATDGVVPPPAPIWYPPYFHGSAPPYGVDPLHFFIDLRVSGHICDRQKREAAAGGVATLPPLSNDRNNKMYTDNEQDANLATIAKLSDIHKYRQGSAFTVPKPRNLNHLEAFNNDSNNNNSTEPVGATAQDVNVTSCEDQLTAMKENQPLIQSLPASFINANRNAANANYMLQKLPQMYSRLAACNIMAAATQHGQHGHEHERDIIESSPIGLVRRRSHEESTIEMDEMSDGNTTINAMQDERMHSTNSERPDEQDSNIVVENDSNESRGSSTEASNNN